MTRTSWIPMSRMSVRPNDSHVPPFILTPSFSLSMDFSDLSIATLNVNGMNSYNKRQGVRLWFRSQGLDLLCLQEVHVDSIQRAAVWGAEAPDIHCVWSPSTSHGAGVAVWMKSSLAQYVDTVSADDEGRLVTVRLVREQQAITICSLYAPVDFTRRLAFFSRHLPVLASLGCFVLGDFNTALSPAVDRRGGAPCARADGVSRDLRSALAAGDFVDVYRRFFPSIPGFTWRKRDGTYSSRIDLVLVPSSDFSTVRSIDVVPCHLSDHCAIRLRVKLGVELKRGPSYWKMNSSLLQNALYDDSIVRLWKSWQADKHLYDDISAWWDVGKARLRDLSRRFGRDLSASRTLSRREHQRAIVECQRQIDSGSLAALYSLEEHRRALSDLDRQELEGARVRSRLMWTEKGETSPKLFTNFERQRAHDSYISCLRDADGLSRSSIGDLLDIGVSFYSDLFSSTKTDPACSDILLRSLERRLSEGERDRLEGPLTSEEFTAALKSMPRNKSPGLDGLTAEFYCHFWDLLCDDLLAVYNSVLSSGRLSASQRCGVVRLLYKKGDKEDLRNWRPISLLNVDYKILSRVLARRLSSVLSTLVHHDQTCCVPRRTIHDNTRLLQDVVDYCTLEGIPAALISLDQEKAFDRVEWSFLHGVLQQMNVGPVYRRWLSTLYTDISSRVIINGYVSRPFGLSRGVRQGCPLSSILYVLVAESLSSFVRASPAVSGLAIGGDDITISQYADDTTIVVTNDASFNGVHECLTVYQRGSGARLNRAKSEGLWVGPWTARSDTPFGMVWHTDLIKCLGVWIGSSSHARSHNWRDATDKFDRVLQRWSGRSLSFVGRATIVKSFAAAKLWHVAHVVPPPSGVVADIVKKSWSFVWHDMRTLVRRTVCTLPTASGGLGALDFDLKVASLHIQWMRRLPLDEPSKWRLFAKFWLDRAASPFGGWEDILKGLHVSASGIPSFYAAIVKQYHRFRCGVSARPKYSDEVDAQFLWGNSAIVDRGGRPLRFASLARAGISLVGQLIAPGGFLDIGELKQRFPLASRLHSLVHFIDRLRAAIPCRWLELPIRRPSERSELQPCLFRDSDCPCPLSEQSSRDIYQNLLQQLYRTPAAIRHWQVYLHRDPPWKQAWESVAAARLSTAYARDVAFKLLHRVLPTRGRLAWWHLASSGECSVCGVPDETLEHVFDRCPLTHNVLHLVGSLFRSLSPNIPPTFTLLEAVFCRNVSRSPPLAALLWIVLVCIWTHRRDTSAHGMAGLIRYRFRERIRVAWYECRRHRQPDYEYFSSQWMPPGITVPLVSISPNRTSLVFHF